MTTTYELYTNENGTPKAVEGKAPAIIDRVGNLETSVENLETSVENLETSVENLETSVETAQATADACLPLSGGTMTGVIYGEGGIICGKTDTSDVCISGGTNSSSNSYIQINGGSRTKQAGEIILVPKTPTGSYSLRATASGLLKWGDKEVERVNSSGDKWIRYENGLQICWGFQSISSSTKITYAVPFADNVIVQVGGTYAGSSYYTALPDSSNTTCSFTVVKISSDLVSLPPEDAPSFSWLAIGRWK